MGSKLPENNGGKRRRSYDSQTRDDAIVMQSKRRFSCPVLDSSSRSESLPQIRLMMITEFAHQSRVHAIRETKKQEVRNLCSSSEIKKVRDFWRSSEFNTEVDVPSPRSISVTESPPDSCKRQKPQIYPKPSNYNIRKRVQRHNSLPAIDLKMIEDHAAFFNDNLLFDQGSSQMETPQVNFEDATLDLEEMSVNMIPYTLSPVHLSPASSPNLSRRNLSPANQNIDGELDEVSKYIDKVVSSAVGCGVMKAHTITICTTQNALNDRVLAVDYLDNLTASAFKPYVRPLSPPSSRHQMITSSTMSGGGGGFGVANVSIFAEAVACQVLEDFFVDATIETRQSLNLHRYSPDLVDIRRSYAPVVPAESWRIRRQHSFGHSSDNDVKEGAGSGKYGMYDDTEWSDTRWELPPPLPSSTASSPLLSYASLLSDDIIQEVFKMLSFERDRIDSSDGDEDDDSNDDDDDDDQNDYDRNRDISEDSDRGESVPDYSDVHEYAEECVVDIISSVLTETYVTTDSGVEETLEEELSIEVAAKYFVNGVIQNALRIVNAREEMPSYGKLCTLSDSNTTQDPVLQNLKDLCDSLSYDTKAGITPDAAVKGGDPGGESEEEAGESCDAHVVDRSPDRGDNQQLFDDWFLKVVQPTNGGKDKVTSEISRDITADQSDYVNSIDMIIRYARRTHKGNNSPGKVSPRKSRRQKDNGSCENFSGFNCCHIPFKEHYDHFTALNTVPQYISDKKSHDYENVPRESPPISPAPWNKSSSFSLKRDISPFIRSDYEGVKNTYKPVDQPILEEVKSIPLTADENTTYAPYNIFVDESKELFELYGDDANSNGETLLNEDNPYYEVKGVQNDPHYYDDITDCTGYYAISGTLPSKASEYEGINDSGTLQGRVYEGIIEDNNPGYDAPVTPPTSSSSPPVDVSDLQVEEVELNVDLYDTHDQLHPTPNNNNNNKDDGSIIPLNNNHFISNNSFPNSFNSGNTHQDYHKLVTSNSSEHLKLSAKLLHQDGGFLSRSQSAKLLYGSDFWHGDPPGHHSIILPPHMVLSNRTIHNQELLRRKSSSFTSSRDYTNSSTTASDVDIFQSYDVDEEGYEVPMDLSHDLSHDLPCEDGDDNEHSYELIQEGAMVTRYQSRDMESRDSLHDIYESIPQANPPSGEAYEVIPEEAGHFYEFIKDTRTTPVTESSSSPDYPAPSETTSTTRDTTHVTSDISSADTSDNESDVAKVPLRRISASKPEKVFTDNEIRRFSEPLLNSREPILDEEASCSAYRPRSIVLTQCPCQTPGPDTDFTHKYRSWSSTSGGMSSISSQDNISDCNLDANSSEDSPSLQSTAVSGEDVMLGEALWDHLSHNSNHLSFRAGDIVEVLQKSGRWWKGQTDNGHVGWFPPQAVRLRISHEVADEEIVSSNPRRMTILQRLNSVSGKRKLNPDWVRQKVIEEIINFEEEFVNNLKDIIEGPLKEARLRADLFDNEKIETLFSNIEELYEFQVLFLESLRAKLNLEFLFKTCIGEVFQKFSTQFVSIYSHYCNAHSASLTEYTLLTQRMIYSIFFESCRLLKEMKQIPLDGYLLTPIQRICQYPLQLKELLKYTSVGHPDRAGVEQAVITMTKVAETVNERKRRIESVRHLVEWQMSIEDWKGDDILTSSSILIHSGDLCKLSSGHKQTRRFFLFDHQLVYCKKLVPSGKFQYRGRINLDMSEVSAVTTSGEVFSWRIHNTSKDKWITLYTKKPSIRDAWAKAFARERKQVAEDKENLFRISTSQKKAAYLHYNRTVNPKKSDFRFRSVSHPNMVLRDSNASSLILEDVKLRKNFPNKFFQKKNKK